MKLLLDLIDNETLRTVEEQYSQDAEYLWGITIANKGSRTALAARCYRLTRWLGEFQAVVPGRNNIRGRNRAPDAFGAHREYTPILW